MKAWSQGEIEFIEANYEKIPITVIAEKLGRTPVQTRREILKLGLKKKAEHTSEYYHKRKLIRQLLNMVRQSANMPLLKAEG